MKRGKGDGVDILATCYFGVTLFSEYVTDCLLTLLALTGENENARRLPEGRVQVSPTMNRVSFCKILIFSSARVLLGLQSRCPKVMHSNLYLV